LASAVKEAESLAASDPVKEFQIMFTEEHLCLIEAVIYPAVLRGCSRRRTVNFPIGNVAYVSEKRINEVYESVKAHLDKVNSWNKTVYMRFQPKTLKDAIRKIFNRFYYGENRVINADSFAWKEEFERLRDYDTVDDFLDDLTVEKKIPPDNEKRAEQWALLEVEARADYLGLVVVKKSEYEEFSIWKAQNGWLLYQRMKNL
jgi:hypothetical protein